MSELHRPLNEWMPSLPKQLDVQIPSYGERWDVIAPHSGHRNNIDRHHVTDTLKNNSQYRQWQWPKRRLFVITDPHADAEAFVSSLVMSGGVVKNSQDVLDFELTKAGRKGVFIIGGDCLDKGPSNLQLLHSVRRLMDTGARVKLLAGNHDMRLFMGIHAMGLKANPMTEHMFVRMGDKVLPLFKEVFEHYIKGKKVSANIPDEAECKRQLFPRDDWFEQFPKVAKSLMTPAGIERELTKMRKKFDHFEKYCKQAGFTLRDIYMIAQKCRQLFLQPKGEFAWFFNEMKLAYRKGSFLFIHAGVDDGMVETLTKKSIKAINKSFQHSIHQDLFHFYFGSMANTLRTKYRPADLPLTQEGVEKLSRKGIHAIVHGHINRKHGQRVAIKQGVLHIECDVTIDRNSRKKEGLNHFGIGVTIIDPSKRIIGMSNDYPHAKIFQPEDYLSVKEA